MGSTGSKNVHLVPSALPSWELVPGEEEPEEELIVPAPEVEGSNLVGRSQMARGRDALYPELHLTAASVFAQRAALVLELVWELAPTLVPEPVPGPAWEPVP